MSALGVLIELVGYSVARAVWPILSFGRIYVEPFTADPQALRWPWYRRDADGRIELRQKAAGCTGVAVCSLMLLALGAGIRTLF